MLVNIYIIIYEIHMSFFAYKISLKIFRSFFINFKSYIEDLYTFK